MSAYDGPERRQAAFHAHERADKAHDVASEALGRIAAHERECVMYREQVGSTLKRIERTVEHLATGQKRAQIYIIGVLLAVCGFLFITLKSQGW